MGDALGARSKKKLGSVGPAGAGVVPAGSKTSGCEGCQRERACVDVCVVPCALT